MSIKEDNFEIVVVKRDDRKGFIQFLIDVEDKINKGYELVKEGSYAPKPRPKAAWFKKKDSVGAEEAVVEVSKEGTLEVATEEVSIDDLKGKQELLDFAEKNGITIPEDVKVPLAIKKLIKEKLESK